MNPNLSSDARPMTGLVVLFALTIFLSAFLLFQVQPMISKFILPWFGGSPAVWTTAMLFFQSTLFGGYVYSHLVGRHLAQERQPLLHLGLLVAAGLLAWFVLPGAALKPIGDESPVPAILGILAASVGLPYFCLATTGPLLQHWYAGLVGSHSVYRLYALSNVGSFLALLSFPYLFEPYLTLPEIGQFWTWGFWLFALLCAMIALIVLRRQPGAASAATTNGAISAAAPAATRIDPTVVEHPRASHRLAWLLLPALASLAFIAVTDHLSHDIAPEPRVWIATLSIYLLSFILTFDNPRWYRPVLTAALCLLAVLFLAGRAEIPGFFGAHWGYGISALRWMHYVALFLICMLCHGELYRRRPANTAYLTEFYLWMSLGGACGGLFVALVATHLFDDYYEWPLMLACAVLLAGAILERERQQSRTHASAQATRALSAEPAAGSSVTRQPAPTLVSWVLIVVLVGCAFWWDNPLRGRVSYAQGASDTPLDQARNFYGVVAVKERRFADEPLRDHRIFYSGQITHGIQYLHPTLRHEPSTYYARDSGVGDAFAWLHERQAAARVALIGLGAGTLATYCRAEDQFDYYEINPEVVRVARKWFDNLDQCRAREQRTFVGDARLKLEQLSDGTRYDLIVLDAFSGGSVPVHLLTREAFASYQARLKPDGLIAINITNAYLNLYPVVKAQAEQLGLSFRHKYQHRVNERYVRDNLWFVMTRDQAFIARYPAVSRAITGPDGQVTGYESLDLPGIPLWTDHYSSLLPIEWQD
jgi:SAM-dependent methyltransferase